MALKLGIPPRLQDFTSENNSRAVDMWFRTVTTRSNAEQTLAVATLSVNQSIVSGVTTKILFDTASYNTDGFFKTASSKFTPTVAGYYQFDSQLAFDLTAFGGAATVAIIIAINGVALLQTNNIVASVAATYTPTQSFVIPLNGTTDFVELYGFQNTAANRNIVAASSFFRATLVRTI